MPGIALSRGRGGGFQAALGGEAVGNGIASWKCPLVAPEPAFRADHGKQ